MHRGPALLCFALCALAHAETVKYTFNVEEWVVDFMRPTASGAKSNQKRQTPFKIPDENRKAAASPGANKGKKKKKPTNEGSSTLDANDVPDSWKQKIALDPKYERA